MNNLTFFEKVDFLDKVIHDEKNLSKALEHIDEFLKDSTLYQYFFDKLDNRAWIDPLKEKGFFKTPPKPVKQEGRGTLFPFWPESRFLARIVLIDKETASIVSSIVLEIPETENVRVHEDIIDIALSVPADLAVHFVEKAIKWVKSPYQIGLPEKIGTLASNLARGGQIDAGLDLAKALLTPKQEKESESDLSLEPQPYFDVWEYEQVIKNNIPDLIEIAGERAFILLCDVLENAIDQSSSPEQKKLREDSSFIWRPAIEDHEQNLGHRLNEILVSAVRDAAAQIAKRNTEQLTRIIDLLEARSWKVFSRIALYILYLFPIASKKLAEERLTNQQIFHDSHLLHEYSLLAEQLFAHLTESKKKIILDFIDQGPIELKDPEYIESLKRDKHGFSNKDIELYKKNWQIKRLFPINENLPEIWKRKYDILVQELGKPENPTFEYYHTSWVGPTSPKSLQELSSMAPEQIITFLKDWQPSGALMEDSFEGLGRTLTAIVTSEPAKFNGIFSQLKNLHPTYIRAFLSGIEEAVKQQRDVSWESILELCNWIVNQPVSYPVEKKYLDRDPGWSWTRKEIARLLGEGFKYEKNGIPFSLRKTSWNILNKLTEDLDPDPKVNGLEDLTSDPATVSINRVRGIAMHSVMHYARWVYLHIKDEPDGEKRLIRGFTEMPEVRVVLETHLDIQKDASLSIRAIYGQWFTMLAALDKDWIGVNITKIFPVEGVNLIYRDVAWETYLLFCSPTKDCFKMLQSQYLDAVKSIRTKDRKYRTLEDPDLRLAQHLMVLYWWGEIDYEEDGTGLINEFFKHASDIICSQALMFLGRNLTDEKSTISTDVLQRCKKLWENRLSIIKKSSDPKRHAKELDAFGWLFVSKKFDPFWSIQNLKESIRLGGKASPTHLVSDLLTEYAQLSPLDVVECLALIYSDEDGLIIHRWRQQTKAILSAVISSSDLQVRKAAIDLVNQLGSKGYLEFRELLSK